MTSVLFNRSKSKLVVFGETRCTDDFCINGEVIKCVDHDTLETNSAVMCSKAKLTVLLVICIVDAIYCYPNLL